MSRHLLRLDSEEVGITTSELLPTVLPCVGISSKATMLRIWPSSIG